MCVCRKHSQAIRLSNRILQLSASDSSSRTDTNQRSANI
ncbi:unnamed protein product [Soboliphyme baturini]|uniref:Uncharacterized protein n=1 Tax=Soboliphyme baturini TaxID=241478 RepID=A0A183JA92_9BILA|nr:unnamed protein product [Soboliphyme baturini]